MTGIVVGVERTPEGVAAVEFAMRQAVSRSLPLIAVRSWGDVVTPDYVGDFFAAAPEQAREHAARLAQEVVKQAAEHVPGADSVDVRALAVPRGAGPALVDAARGKVLLVVGVRSASALSRALLGSTSRYVLHHAPCPVVLVPATAAAPPEHGSRILVGVDHSPSSCAALAWGADEAARREAAVLAPVLVREQVWATDISAEGEMLHLADLEACERYRLREDVPADVQVLVDPAVEAGHVGRTLVRLAEPDDLIVVGSRGRRAPVSTLLGSTSTYVAEHARCPVVVVREDQAG